MPMSFWKDLTGQDDDRRGASEPSFLQKLTDFGKDTAKDMAVSHVVESLTGGWITYESDDEEDEPAQRRKKGEGTLEERLNRSLAELNAQSSAPQRDIAPPAPIQPPQPVAAIAPVVRPAPHRAQGFGRKGL
jgi:hypothetical protein